MSNFAEKISEQVDTVKGMLGNIMADEEIDEIDKELEEFNNIAESVERMDSSSPFSPKKRPSSGQNLDTDKGEMPACAFCARSAENLVIIGGDFADKDHDSKFLPVCTGHLSIARTRSMSFGDFHDHFS